MHKQPDARAWHFTHLLIALALSAFVRYTHTKIATSSERIGFDRSGPYIVLICWSDAGYQAFLSTFSSSLSAMRHTFFFSFGPRPSLSMHLYNIERESLGLSLSLSLPTTGYCILVVRRIGCARGVCRYSRALCDVRSRRRESRACARPTHFSLFSVFLSSARATPLSCVLGLYIPPLPFDLSFCSTPEDYIYEHSSRGINES